ncbi:MAG: DUF1028 domain-containing protein [Hyphomicrobiales bacterium]
MTFSLIGRCTETGAFGVAITTSSICVGARCPHVRANAGAVATQNITDPALGPAILDELENGSNAEAALAATMAGKEHLDYRQLTVIDKNGATASFTGANILGTNAVSAGNDCFAAGNLLKTNAVVSAMTQGFEKSVGAHIAERLLRGLEAGVGAGGEEGPTHSAALLVAHKQSFPLVDLRVDWDDHDPVAALRRLWTDYEPQMNDYLIRAIDPDNAPSYGVPGDE